MGGGGWRGGVDGGRGGDGGRGEGMEGEGRGRGVEGRSGVGGGENARVQQTTIVEVMSTHLRH